MKPVKVAIQRCLGSLGYQIVKAPPSLAPNGRAKHPHHETVYLCDCYAAWYRDAHFLPTYEVINDYTLVDRYRCWELWQLVEQSAKLSGSLLEVGVWRGGTGGLIAKKAALCGITDPVYLCDTFRGVVKAGEFDNAYVGGEHADTSRAEVESLLVDRLGLANFRILEGVFPEESAGLIEPEHQLFRLCHIDVDVYQSGKEIFDWVWGRMVVGGIVVFDDYGYERCEGITRLVDAQAGEPDRVVIRNLTNHAIVVKIR